VPMAHWGTQQIMPRYGKKIVLFRRKKVDVIYGDTIDLAEFRGRPLEPAMLAEATTVVMDRIAGLLSELRDEPVPAQRWDPS
ncbi:1-acyl-sn-glycerol-3-phosphate acyltransferase, partial [Rhizobium johnstonii]|uniref:hypothetical protein n=1 Tax=Rhizobium johnstonii TaxID=3019933 RepID=UPI003F992ADB